jgi:hypothetical protein
MSDAYHLKKEALNVKLFAIKLVKIYKVHVVY